MHYRNCIINTCDALYYNSLQQNILPVNIFFIIFAQRNTVFRSLQTCLKYQVFDKFSRHEKKSCLSQTKKGSIVVYQLYKTHTTLGTFPVSSFCVRVCVYATVHLYIKCV